MFIAKVIGNVVSTQKNAKFRGMKLLLVQPYISKEGKLQISAAAPWSRLTAWEPASASACCLRRAVPLA